MSLTRDEQERLANLNYRLGVEETQPIAVCQNGCDVWPCEVDAMKRHAATGLRACDKCGAPVSSYSGAR